MAVEYLTKLWLRKEEDPVYMKAQYYQAKYKVKKTDKNEEFLYESSDDEDEFD